MTTPAGVPNLPIGALTVETLGQRLQDQTAAAMRNRAGEQMPSIFGLSTGGNIASDLSPFGILTNIWAGINSLIANSDPNDIQGPEDLPPLFMDFIENLPVIGQFVQLLEALAGTYDGDDTTLLAIQELLAPIRLLVDTIGQDIADWLNWLVGTLFNGSTDPLTNIFTTLAGLLDDAGELTTWLDSLLTDTWETLLTTLETLFGGFDLETFLQPLFAFLSWLWNGVTGGFAGFGSTVDTVLKPLIEFLNWLWALFSTTAIGSMETLKNIFTELSKVLDSNGALTTWIGNIPLIGPLVKYLTANIPNIDFTPDLAGLGQWANQLLHLDSSLPAGNLIGEIPQAMLSMIPVANINISSANLLGQGSFATASTVDAANGWEWDSTTNDPSGQSSGSAKLTTDGTARYLYARQAIKVAAGDKITLSARIKTANYTGTGTSITLSVIPYAGTTVQTEKVFASRGASNGSWATMTGSASDVNPYIVPAGVTSLIVKIGVTSASGTGSTLWVDNVDLRKEGLLGQNLVEYLLNAWENMWQGLVGTSGSGKTWADMFNAANFLRVFANGTQLDLSTLSGNLIDAPAEVLGSLFSVVFDGSKTVGDFLKLLYNALNKSSSTTPKTAEDVANAAEAARDQADIGVLNAGTAMGDAAQAASDASDALAAANGASGSVTNLKTSLLTGYSVVTINSTTTWTKPDNLSELYVVLFGAGATGSTGSTSAPASGTIINGGAGGAAGNVVATQVNLSLLTSLSSVAVTIGSTASPTTYFGSIVNSAASFANYVATPVGLMPSASLPTAGGKGGSYDGIASVAIAAAAGATTSAGVAGGSAGAATSGFTSPRTGGAGGAGGSGVLFGSLSQAGGSGGGGGGTCTGTGSGSYTGGTGGAGGFPGGGGGGGGVAISSYTNTGGPGGAGANGMAIIVYKIAKTTA